MSRPALWPSHTSEASWVRADAHARHQPDKGLDAGNQQDGNTEPDPEAVLESLRTHRRDPIPA